MRHSLSKGQISHEVSTYFGWTGLHRYSLLLHVYLLFPKRTIKLKKINDRIYICRERLRAYLFFFLIIIHRYSRCIFYTITLVLFLIGEKSCVCVCSGCISHSRKMNEESFVFLPAYNVLHRDTHFDPFLILQLSNANDQHLMVHVRR